LLTKDGNTIDFLLRAHRDKIAARRYFEKSIVLSGFPETVTVVDRRMPKWLPVSEKRRIRAYHRAACT
jgi:transposase-like protein